jgi:hypothetical protein
VVRYTTPMAQEKLQSTLFQQDQAASDPLYSKIAYAANQYDGDAHQFTETLWNSCSHIIESDAPERARKHDFYSVWWELYLAYALSQTGISFVANNARPKVVGKGRPDLLAENPRVWIEAVMPQSGDGPDALTEPVCGGVYSVPLEGLTLRLITAIRSKATVIQTYMEEGTISRSDTTIIAVSGGRLPISFRFNGYPVPDPVRAVYGVSYLAMEFDIQSMEQTGTSVQVCGEALKKSRSPVATDFFLQSESSHVSAVLYSYADCVNYGRVPGSEFILVHNPQARVPLPKNWLRLGRQYSLEGQQLRCDSALGRVSTTPG